MDILACWQERCSLGWMRVCLGRPFAFVTTTGQAGPAVTPEASVAHSHLSTPISIACVPLSGPHKQDGAWRDDDKNWGGGAGGVAGLWWDGLENSESKELSWASCAACEFAATGPPLLTNTWDDCPLMSFTVLRLSQCDRLVTALSLTVLIISPFGCIRKPILDIQSHASSSSVHFRLNWISHSYCVRGKWMIHIWTAESTSNTLW